MELGKINYKRKCPQCAYTFETADPEGRVPEHNTTDNPSTKCPGSDQIGKDIGRRIDPKIK